MISNNLKGAPSKLCLGGLLGPVSRRKFMRIPNALSLHGFQGRTDSQVRLGRTLYILSR
jgi:hypothetical protein